MAKTGKVFFKNLDTLRFFAFFAIFIHHGIFATSPIVEESAVLKNILYAIKPAGLGVPFFFCLSGFLITYLLLVEIGNNGRISIKDFYMRRVLRIWPLYYAVVIFGFFIFPGIRGLLGMEAYEETANLGYYLAFLGNFDQIRNGLPYGAGLGVTWSLSVEEQFYLVWPLILTVVPRRWFGALTFALFLLGTYCLYGIHLHYHHTFVSMMDLALGGFLAVIAFEKSEFFNRITRLPGYAIGLLYTIGLLHLYTFYFAGIGNRALVTIFMVFVIFDQCFAKNSLISLGQFRTLSYMGTLTYGFYLLHTICNFITSSIWSFLPRTGNTMPFVIDLGIQPVSSLLLTFLIGYLSYRYFESPFLRLKKRFARIETVR